jgi:hypothetical protein
MIAITLTDLNLEILESPTMNETIRARIAPRTVNWIVVIVPLISIG